MPICFIDESLKPITDSFDPQSVPCLLSFVCSASLNVPRAFPHLLLPFSNPFNQISGKRVSRNQYFPLNHPSLTIETKSIETLLFSSSFLASLSKSPNSHSFLKLPIELRVFLRMRGFLEFLQHFLVQFGRFVGLQSTRPSEVPPTGNAVELPESRQILIGALCQELL